MYFEMQKDAHLVSDGFLHCYLILTVCTVCVFGSGWSKNWCGGVVVCFKACKIILGVWGICICILGLSFETFD